MGKRVKLKELISESWMDEEEKSISTDQKRAFLEAVKQFNKFGKMIYREGNLHDVAKNLGKVCKVAENFTIKEAGDWFDKITVQRNMKQLNSLGGDFGKVATEAQSLQDRMTALYEDMGHILQRYYEIDDELAEELGGIENIEETEKKSVTEAVKFDKAKMLKLVNKDKFLSYNYKKSGNNDKALKQVFDKYVSGDKDMEAAYTKVK